MYSFATLLLLLSSSLQRKAGVSKNDIKAFTYSLCFSMASVPTAPSKLVVSGHFLLTDSGAMRSI